MIELCKVFDLITHINILEDLSPSMVTELNPLHSMHKVKVQTKIGWVGLKGFLVNFQK